MDLEVSYSFENAEQFWDELSDVTSVTTQDYESIDNALRSFLSLITNYRNEYICSEEDFARYSIILLQSTLFKTNKEYVCRQIVYSLLQDESPDLLQAVAAILLYEGKEDDSIFQMMNAEGAFTRLQELIQAGTGLETGLHPRLLELLYEMSRIQRIRFEDLSLIDDNFIMYMYQTNEDLSDDVNDPYHLHVIRVLLVLNEQYMLCSHDPTSDKVEGRAPTLTNKVVKVLAHHGPIYKSFGQNIILLLNRESETSLQLLILKLLYLLFTSPPTYEYFYTNDLHVLLDIILRNLLDLPSSASALRHTYLRVLYPFLSHSQLKHPPHYKRDDILRLLDILSETSIGHFGAVDDTTKRLVERCSKVGWINGGDIRKVAGELDRDNAKYLKPAKNAFLHTGTIKQASESSLSVFEVAAQKSKPGVKTPSNGRMAEISANNLRNDH